MDYKLGIDLGGTTVKACVAADGKIIARARADTPEDGEFEAVVSAIASTAGKAADKAGLNLSRFARAGVGAPGLVDAESGTVIYSNNIRWRDAPLASRLGEVLGMGVKVTNDAKAAALGETLFGAGRGLDRVVMLTLGTGVGGGVVVDKKIYEGAGGAGGLLGHVVIKAGGRRCTCGRNGCLEAYASAAALAFYAQRAVRAVTRRGIKTALSAETVLTGENIFRHARNGDFAAAYAADEYADYLAEGVVNAVNVFRPDAVILGGGISLAGGFLLNRVKAHCEGKIFGAPYAEPQILLSALGADAGLLGAAYL